jgi:hypothetical protein
MSTQHPFDTELALYAGGDLRGWERLKTAFHVRGCERCQGNIQAFRLDQQRLQESVDEMPGGVNWDRLSSEMAANIRVGLAAGECVAPLMRESEPAGWNWKPAGAVAGLVMVFGAAWWLNMPARDTAFLSRAFGISAGRPEDRGPVLEASSEGIEFRENGSALGVSTSDAQPVATSVSFGGSASARYVDDDTGQVTIATVYVQ